MKTHISKAYRGNKHIGFKKTVAGRAFFLGYGISAADEAKAIELAELLEAKWRLQKAAGCPGLTATDFEEARALISKQPKWVSARASAEELAIQAASVPEVSDSMVNRMVGHPDRPPAGASATGGESC